MWRKTINTLFYVLHSDKTWPVFDQLERPQGPVYIMKQNKTKENFENAPKYHRQHQAISSTALYEQVQQG